MTIARSSVKHLVSLAAAAALALTVAGCTYTPQSDVSTGDGPAVATKPAPSRAASPTEQDASRQGQSSTDDSFDQGGAEEKVATFTDKIIYTDGVEIEVTKHKQAKIGEWTMVDDDSAKPGDPYTVLTIRVKNGTHDRLDLFGSATVTYGPDGEEAPSVYDDGIEPFDGTVLPGKARTGTWGFVIPKKHLDDVTLEVDFDFAHESAIFSGSLN